MPTNPRSPVGELKRFTGEPPWVLAVSGGLDSMALLYAAMKVGKPFDVVTVNHGLRAAAADETALVKSFYPQTHVIKLKPPARANLAWARDARYDALKKIAKGRLILTAHHRDDLVETLFLQLLRGTTPSTWATFNMPGVARPFLSLPRRDLERFAHKHNLPYVNDPSNQDESHPRAVVRHQLIPLLHTFAPPGWEDRLLRFHTAVRTLALPPTNSR